MRLDGVISKAVAPDRSRAVMQEASAEKFTDEEAHAAGGLEMIHVRLAVRIDPGHQRRHLRKIGEILPGERDARGRGHRDEVNGEIGRAAVSMEADDAVDDRSL